MMTFSLAAIMGLEKCCITSAYLQWLCHSGERAVARGPLVFLLSLFFFVFFFVVPLLFICSSALLPLVPREGCSS